ncbi:MAG: DUF167 domain-containing protein [Candidatus Aenigmarchaeota archaeon]|nr:DUF167 domain-containing protein [Candidatus Aenigmarchaeota archaeon]
MLIQATVKTNQKKFSVEKNGDKWVISVRAAPEHNKANIEIIKELSKEYKNVRIVKGLKSSKKLIEVL